MLIRGELQSDVINSNFENFESALCEYTFIFIVHLYKPNQSLYICDLLQILNQN